VDIATDYADRTPMDPNASAKMHWELALAFQNARLELNPSVPVFSDIDGHQVNSLDRRQPLGSFTLFSFSAKIDPVATMLVQNHRQVIPDFYGLTTSFTRPGDLDLFRRPRPGRPTAPDRRPTDRPFAPSPLAGLPTDPEQCALPRREEEGAKDLTGACFSAAGRSRSH
jgi:hypothetical protein